MKMMLFLILILLFGFGCSSDTQPEEKVVEVEEEVEVVEEKEEELPEGAVVVTKEEFDMYLRKISWLYKEAELSKEKSEEIEEVTVIRTDEDFSEKDLKEIAKEEILKMEAGKIYFEERNVSVTPEEMEEMTDRHVKRFDTNSQEHMFVLLQDIFGCSREDLLQDIEFEVKQEKVAAERIEEISLVISFEEEEVERAAKMAIAKKEVLEEIMEIAEEMELIIK